MKKIDTRNQLPYVWIAAGILLTLLLVMYLYVKKTSPVQSDYQTIFPIATHSNGDNYVGSEACRACHADIYKTHLETAHYHSSSLADSGSVKGSFKKDKNLYQLNDSIRFKMLLEDSEMYQQAWNIISGEKISKSKIDVVIGSGTKGQSYLSWENDKLYQLQVSYFTPTDSWTNSPGIPMQLMEQRRPANAKCLECHTTFAKNTALYGMGNSYDKSQIMYGIDCERCHGPLQKHVTFHKNNPELSEARYVINHDTLSRQQRLDACALCHSGVRMDIQPAFLFLTGDKLTEYSLPDSNAKDLEGIDVHGNQYDLLRASTCFKQTESMDCTSCHNPHKNERGDSASFNTKCMKCHSKNSILCKVDPLLSNQKNTNCVACHMPLIPSKSMFVQIGRDSLKVPVMVRTHLIDIYAQSETEKGDAKM
ncbi:multiheme c-type cytochrome [Ulvibacterium sp.]|uniref:multiheme c-type cytochrome n=1 Tax=Ulvibacterium sp. TaxID=2665914 RepID=UPI00260E9AEB|nr:multiheme c-type cytochrome [Ulvibacterium sp.]